MSDSIWKKEISFKKKDKPAAAETPVDEAPAPKQSVWKKEISLKKKDKPEAAPEPAAPKQSVWKKDISLKKKDKPAAAAEAAAPKQSIWKKELSLGGKKRDRAVERLAEEAVQAVAPAFETSVPEPPPAALPTAIAEAAVAAMPVEPVEPVAIPPLPPLELAPEPAPVELAPAPEPYAGLSPEIVAATEPVPVFEPAPVFEPVPEYTPVPEYAPAPEYAPQPVEEWPAPEPVAAEPEPWLAEPELPPTPEAPAPVVVHPPVPAAELEPVVEPKVSFWKKDLSLSRGAKEPKQPKAAKAPKPAGEKLWKKEISFKRTPKTIAADAPTESMPAAPKGSVLKRDLALPKLSMPSLSRSRSTKGGHSVKRYVGLKIGSSQLAAARVSNNGSAELLQLARDPLAQGIVVAGELREPEALAEALKAFFARHKLPKKNVRIGIASNRIGVRIFDVLGIEDDKQLANAIQFRAQEALPIPLDEAVLDYRVLEETVDGEGRPVKRVLLVVAYRDLVDRYIGACKKAGIGLVGIDLEAFAMLRSLAAPTERGAAAMVAVAIGHDRSTFAVTDGRICEFTRVLEWGGWSLNIALARALDSAPSEMESVKRAMSIDANMVVEGLTPEQSAAALDAVRNQLQSFARELVSSLQFYQNQPGSLAIGSIVITGGTAHMPGLAVELERLIGVPVTIGDPLARVKTSKKLATPEPLGSLSVAIGLGIED